MKRTKVYFFQLPGIGTLVDEITIFVGWTCAAFASVIQFHLRDGLCSLLPYFGKTYSLKTWVTSRLANPTRLTMRRIDFSLRRWGQCRRVRYLKCEVVWRWSECGHSWQLSCSYEAFCLWNFVECGEVEVSRPP